MLQIVGYRQVGTTKSGEPKMGMVFVDPHKPVLVPDIPTLFRRYEDVVALFPEPERYNLFYTLAHHTGAESLAAATRISVPQRSKQTFFYQTVLAWDVDDADVTRAEDYATCVGAVLGVDKAALTVIVSGNGVHVLVQLRKPIRSVEWFDEHKEHFYEVCRKIEEQFTESGLRFRAGGSAECFDPARVLRVPGSVNRKSGKEDTCCRLIRSSDAVVSVDLQTLSGLGNLRAGNISEGEIRRVYPDPDFAEIVRSCRFIRSCIENPSELHEPQAFDLFGLLAPIRADSTVEVEVEGKTYTPKTLAKHIAGQAVNSVTLSENAFEHKWQHAVKYGARKCSTLNDKWDGCRECAHWGKIVTPLALKSKEHIGSEVNGYWVLNTKGNYSYPHYGDLAKVFKEECEFKVTPVGRMMRWNGTQYAEMQPLAAKKWLEQKMVPADPLKETHRMEFVHKLRAVGCIEDDEARAIWEDNTDGRINYANGVLDVRTGELMPHDPSMGFMYTLPYAYEDCDGSETFLDWLDQVMCHRSELMESVLDMMAYCMWPAYDDHCFMVLSGTGNNGKSTFLRVLESLLGKQNVAAVSLKQLTQNRFAPAALEGKLANLSGESSGVEVTYEMANVLKNLTGNDDIFVEKKGQDGYTFRNRAKIIFSMNNAPVWKDQGTALKRRLIQIPFKYQIPVGEGDERVVHRLVDDAPKIAAMLVRRIRENYKANGRFLVSRGGTTAHQAQVAALAHGNTVMEWARDHVVSSVMLPDTERVTVKDAYGRYIAWCAANNIMRPANRITFSRVMRTGVVTSAAQEERAPDYKEIAGRVYRKTVRVFSRTKFVDTDD